MIATIAPATTEADIAAAARLFRAYAAALGVDLSYQGFAAELAALPGDYAPPGGALLLARAGGEAVGCVALRPSGDGAEMKRLFVAPAGRGHGLGERLARAALAEAVRLGHRSVRLDTLPDMAAAQALYAKLGFVPVPPYYAGAPAGTIFMSCRLPVPA